MTAEQALPKHAPPAGGSAELRNTLAPRSLLSQVVETQLLPVERLKGQPKGEVVDIKKVGEVMAALEKVEDHYEVAVFDGRGNMTEIVVDPTSHELAGMMSKETGLKLKRNGGGRNVSEFTAEFQLSPHQAELLEEALYSKAPVFFNNVASFQNSGYAMQSELKSKVSFPLPIGDWNMGEARVFWDKESQDTFYFVCGEKRYALRLRPDLEKTGFKIKSPDEANPNVTNLRESFKLRREATLFRLENKTGNELVAYSGTDPVADPAEPNSLYFINAGQVYRLDLSGVENRTTRPVLVQQIQLTDVNEIDFEPNGNFLMVRTGNGKLSVVDKESGDVVRTFDNVKGPVLVDKQGDIVYVDSEGKLREIQTNFQAIPAGGSEQAQARREQQLRELQERFAGLELGKVPRQRGAQISEADVAQTLRESVSRQVSEQINTSTDPAVLEDVLDQLQGFKGDPVNQAYGEVIDEFIVSARGKLSEIRTGEFDGWLSEFQKALDEVESVGDTIGLDEQFARLLALRQKIDITDPVKKREIKQRLQTLQTLKDDMTGLYQGELVEAAQVTLPQLEELIKETGSAQELAYFATSTQAQQFEMMLANIRDPQVRRDLRDRYQAIRNEQRARLEEVSRQVAEQDNQRWAQVVAEAREDLNSLREQIEQLSDTREIDRFGKNPLVTAWRARLFALPPELREIEEKRLEIILGARKKDMEHRRELGAEGEAGELKFGSVTFPVYKEPPRVWQPKLLPKKGQFSQWADLVFEDGEGKIWRPEGENEVLASTVPGDERTQGLIERYRRQAEEYFRGMRRKVPEFDNHWRLAQFQMEKLAEIAESINFQLEPPPKGITVLEGDTGTGKSALADILANLSSREVITIACNENTVREDLTYEFVYDPKTGSYKLPARLVTGIKKPGVIVLFEELNTIKPGIVKMLNPLFDYKRRLIVNEGGVENEIIADPTVIFVATMNPQDYAGVVPLAETILSRSDVIEVGYPPFEEHRGGRTYYRSDEAEMLYSYLRSLSGLQQREFKLCWDYEKNRDTTNGADRLLQGDPQIKKDVSRLYDAIRVANRLRQMYQAFKTGESNEPMDFSTSIREMVNVAQRLNHTADVKQVVKRIILPKIGDRRQRVMVGQTIDAVLPE